MSCSSPVGSASRSLAGEQLSGRISAGFGVCAFLKGDWFANPGNGGVAEWSKAAVLKTAVSKGTRGSNPFASASKPPEPRGFGVWGTSDVASSSGALEVACSKRQGRTVRAGRDDTADLLGTLGIAGCL